MYAIVCAALIGQVSLDMGTELGSGALDPLPVSTGKATPRPGSYNHPDMIARREESKYRLARQREERRQRAQELKTAYGQARASARRYRIANGITSGYAQRLQAAYAGQVAQHGRAMGYIRATPPSCSTTRRSVYGY